MTNLASKIQQVAMENPTATALDGEASLTYSTLWAETDAFAGALRDRDITAGDAVALRLSHPRALLVAVYGTLRNGSVPVTMPAGYDTRDAVAVLNETDGKAFVTDDARIMSILNRAESVRVAITVDCDVRMGVSFATTLENDGMNGSGSRTGIDVARRSGDDRGLIAYVGRADGEPLGVGYTHSALAAAADVGGSLLEFDGGGHLGALPLSNPVELLYGATATILAGGRYAPAPDRDPESLRSAIATDDVDRTFLTPDRYAALREREADADGSIGVIEPTTASLEAQSGDAIRLRGHPETGLTHRLASETTAANAPGEPLPTVETRVLDDHRDGSGDADGDGELAVWSPATMDGYVDRPELTDDVTVTIDGDRWLRIGALERPNRT